MFAVSVRVPNLKANSQEILWCLSVRVNRDSQMGLSLNLQGPFGRLWCEFRDSEGQLTNHKELDQVQEGWTLRACELMSQTGRTDETADSEGILA